MTGKVFKVATEGADAVARDFVRIGAAGADMEKKLTQGAKAINPALRGIDTAAAEAKKSVDGLAGGAGVLGKVFASMGPVGIAAAAGIGALTAGFVAVQGAARTATTEMLALQGAAKQAGVGVEFLQELRAAMNAAGRDAAAVEPALKTFSVRLGEIATGKGDEQIALLARIGITREDVAQFASAEDGLLKIAEAASKVDDAVAGNVLDKFGVRDLLPALEGGAAGFRKVADEARAAGLIIEDDVVARAAQTAREWEKSSKIIDTQLKQAALDAAPAFLELAKIAADMARAVTDTLDNFRRLEDKSTANLRREIAAAQREAQALIDGRGSLSASRADALDPERNERRLRDLQVQIRSGLQELGQRQRAADLRVDVAVQPRVSQPTLTTPTAPAVDTERARLEQLLATMDKATEAAAAYTAVKERMTGATDAEIRATLQLEATLRDLDAARAKGVITSDEDLARRKTAVILANDQAQAEARRAAALAEVQGLIAQAQTPTEVYVDTMKKLAAAQAAGAITADEFARGQANALAALDDALAAIDAGIDSARRRVADDLEGVVRSGFDTLEERLRSGQAFDKEAIVETLAQSLRDILYDGFVGTQLDDLEEQAVAKIRDFTDRIFSRSRGAGSGGVLGAGGILNLDNVAGAVGGALGGRDAKTEGVGQLNAASKEAAKSLKQNLAGSAAEAAAQLVIQRMAGAAKASVEASTSAAVIAANKILASSALSAAKALARVAASSTTKSGDSGGSYLSLITSFVGAFADGGDFTPGWAMVGERGPELVKFGAPGRVYDNVDTMRMLGAQTQAPTLNFSPQITLMNGGPEEVAALRGELDRQRAELEGLLRSFDARVWSATNEGRRRRFIK